MNVRRFSGRTAREALAGVRQAFGDDAVVLTTRPCDAGVEVLAMAPDGLEQIDQASVPTAPVRAAPTPAVAARSPEPARASRDVGDDVSELGMSTMSFQSYVRERMLKRREAVLRDEASEALAARVAAPAAVAAVAPAIVSTPMPPSLPAPHAPTQAAASAARLAPATAAPASLAMDPAWLNPITERARDAASPAREPAVAASAGAAAVQREPVATQREQAAIVAELRQVRGLIEDRFGALAYLDKLQRHPAHARLTQKLLDCGFSAALIRKLAEHMSPAVPDESEWVAGVLERNLATGEHESALEDQGGVYALVGATGVGKTTSTAKLAAAFAAKHGAANLGLVTLDAYRVGAHEQLRAYGRILGVPVHTAHDQASLEDLLQLLSAKKMVLIDTAGMAQRDARTTELLDMLDHPSVHKLLVLNCAAQGETLEDVIVSYRGERARGVVLSKLDEAVKLAPALDAVIRHRLCVLGVANGPRVPEDWHRLPAQVLVHRALRATAWSAYRIDASDVPLVFTAPPALHATPMAQAVAHV